MRADVIVVGGGSAGVAAAVSAARSGASAMLIERDPVPGGQVPGAFVHTICGLYEIRPDADAPLVFANPGFPAEFARRLGVDGGCGEPVRMGILDVLPVDPWAFGGLAEKFCAEQPALTLLRNSTLRQAESEQGGFRIQFEHDGEIRAATCAALIDTTGDGEVSALLGAGWDRSPRLQRPAFVIQLSGVNPTALDDSGKMRLAHALASAVMDGHLPAFAMSTAFRRGLSPDTIWATTDLEAPGFDPLDPKAAASLAEQCRNDAALLVGFLRENIEGFANAEVCAWPRRIGIRESRRIHGRYELTGKDLLDGAKFSDGVAHSAWPIELRETATGPKLRFPRQPCEIPLRALQSRDLPGLYMAGRCMACDHEAHAALRVIGTCMATGEAAGAAAAAAALGPG